MAGTITLTHNAWHEIRDRLMEDYPRSYLLLNSVMKRELGFTVRNHREYPKDEDDVIYDSNGSWVLYKEVICLDFYDDVKETFFRMKYL